MMTEQDDMYIGKTVAYEAVDHVVNEAQEYCDSEKVRIEMVNRPEIIALRAELALLGEQERYLKERMRQAPLPGNSRKNRRRGLYYWAIVVFLAVAGFFFTLMAFAPYRFGWKSYLYALGVAIICPYCVDKFLECWDRTRLIKALATAACIAAVTSLVLLALIRGNVLAQYVQNVSPAVIIDGESTVPPSHNDFFDATLVYLRLAMALLAFGMELGAGLALHDARRVSSDSGEDYVELGREHQAVCQAMVVRIRRLNAFQNAPQAFEAAFWRDFHRALLNGATRHALKRISLLLLCVFLFRPGLVFGAERVRVVVALDLTMSEAITGSDSKAEFKKNLDAISDLLAHLPAGARVTVLGITADSFAQPYLLLDARLDEDEGYFKERLAAGRTQLAAVWKQRCAHLQPGSPHTDIFGALLVAAELFKQSPHARKVLVMFSDMRQETAAIDLERPATVTAAQSLAKAEKNQLLADLEGADIYVLGVNSAGKSVGYWNSLRDFWTEYFRRVGAHLRNYSIFRELPDTATSR